MSEARKAIFARFNCSNSTAAYLHEQLTRGYVKLMGQYKELPFTNDKEANGNLILVHCFELQQESERKLLERHEAEMRQAIPFRNMFGIPLRRYWNPQFGFDICNFDTDIVKSPDGESPKDAIQRQWGDEGLAIIVDLMK